MTDKEEIIIDGMDVSGCEYVCNTAFGNIGCKLPFSEEIHCCNIPNCYFKQLARKTQECEELLKENQQLRNSLSDSLMFKFTGQENETNRYRKALEEIEEYIYNNTDFDVNDSIQSKTSGYDILQIIKDV